MQKINNTGVICGVVEWFATVTKVPAEHLRVFLLLAALSFFAMVVPVFVVLLFLGAVVYMIIAVMIQMKQGEKRSGPVRHVSD